MRCPEDNSRIRNSSKTAYERAVGLRSRLSIRRPNKRILQIDVKRSLDSRLSHHRQILERRRNQSPQSRRERLPGDVAAFRPLKKLLCLVPNLE